MRSILFFLFCLTVSFSFGQDDGSVFAFKKDWSPAKNMNQAEYFVHKVKENDTTFICRYYQKNGPMIKWETFRDADLTIPNGRFAWYNDKGRLDSTGYVLNGKKDKEWIYAYNDSGRATLVGVYENGKLQKRVDYLTKLVRYADGTTEPLNKPVQKKDSSEKVFTIIQVTASFEGGIPGWTHYLETNLRTPDRLLSLSRPGVRAKVTVSFTVSKEGDVSNIFIEKSYEWSADMEAIRILKTSPRWKPATQNGKPVIYRHTQSITFAVN